MPKKKDPKTKEVKVRLDEKQFLRLRRVQAQTMIKDGKKLTDQGILEEFLVGWIEKNEARLGLSDLRAVGE